MANWKLFLALSSLTKTFFNPITTIFELSKSTYTDGIITLPEPHGLTENGDSIKLLVTTEATNIFCPFTIIDTKTIQIDTSNLESNEASMLSNDPLYDDDGNQLDYNIFVYGTKVEDFHILNKAAIWSTGIAALQEVDRQLQA